mmetsp:Transcript_2681/g.5662  ORF Transcript_2681/g.5662 Transcript_2681/m.5662 type:complete len:223 (-) Transcript_2681:146-814(-)
MTGSAGSKQPRRRSQAAKGNRGAVAKARIGRLLASRTAKPIDPAQPLLSIMEPVQLLLSIMESVPRAPYVPLKYSERRPSIKKRRVESMAVARKAKYAKALRKGTDTEGQEGGEPDTEEQEGEGPAAAGSLGPGMTDIVDESGGGGHSSEGISALLASSMQLPKLPRRPSIRQVRLARLAQARKAKAAKVKAGRMGTATEGHDTEGQEAVEGLQAFFAGEGQ